MKNFLTLVILLSAIRLCAQITDTAHLPEVRIVSWFSERPLLRTQASVGVIDSNQLAQQHGQSLVPAMNMIPGVRMEERSPGSYRLSIRGSLLRSPFGIRNVKVYADEFPLTDAGGNTYLNLIDPLAIKRVEIIKGPDGSLFGANSGGVVHLHLTDPGYPSMQAGISSGSFGFLHTQTQAQLHWRKHRFEIMDGWQQSMGYRDNSQMNRQYFQIADEWKYTEGFSLKLLFFVSDLNYRTPGGLTFEQFQQDPRDARPGAEQQRAGVRNRTYFAGIHHTSRIVQNVEHHFLASGSLTEFRNPFITNIEWRDEKSGAIRTWVNTTFVPDDGFTWNAWLGFEGQHTFSIVDNYANANGARDSLLDADDLEAINYFGFARLVLDVKSRLTIEAAASMNYNALVFESFYPVAVEKTRRDFTPQLMPKLAVAWQFFANMVIRAQVARGYSPPTIAEIRASDNTINTELSPESGWNYEVGLRVIDEKEILWWDFSAFYYRLENAIVRRVDETGTESFVNSGETTQPGFENAIIFHVLKERQTGVFRDLIVSNSYTYYAFRFTDYLVDTVNYKDNRLTGVPENVLASSVQVSFPVGFSLYVQHVFVTRIPLDDANSVFADPYNLLQAKISWRHGFNRFSLKIFFGADNLLDEVYSLGHDINAGGRRFYNPSPERNYYGGVSVAF